MQLKHYRFLYVYFTCWPLKMQTLSKNETLCRVSRFQMMTADCSQATFMPSRQHETTQLGVVAASIASFKRDAMRREQKQTNKHLSRESQPDHQDHLPAESAHNGGEAVVVTCAICAFEAHAKQVAMRLNSLVCMLAGRTALQTGRSSTKRTNAFCRMQITQPRVDLLFQ